MVQGSSERWLFPLLLLSFGSGVAALIYEVLWFQLLELVIGSSAVSLGVLLATFMGGLCIGSLIFPRLVSIKRHPLRVYAAIEIGIGILGMLMLVLMPLVGRVYTAWGGDGVGGFLLRGAVAAGCLMPPTLLMGATLPALTRCVEPTRNGASWMGFFYGSNIAGAVFGSLLSGFFLLREYDVVTATWVAAALNGAVAAIAWLFASVAFQRRHVETSTRSDAFSIPVRNSSVYVVIALSGFCALAGEAIWTRILGLLFGASVYAFSIILAVFLIGLGIGSGIGSLLCRSQVHPKLALGCAQLLVAGAIAWTAYNVSASLPFWPIDPSISSDIWFDFQLDLDRALWALLPPTLLWGASFPLALAAVAPKQQDSARLVTGIYAANTFGAIVGALSVSLLLIAWVGSQRAEQLLIALSTLAGLILLLPAGRLGMGMGIVGVLLCGLWITGVPPLEKLLVAHGRYAATWAGKSNIIYAEEGLNSSVAVSSFPNGATTFHVAGKIQASSVPRDMRLQRMLGHLTSLTVAHPHSVLVIGCGAGVTAGAVSIDPRVERETIVEIETLVPHAAATFFGRENFDVVGNPKVHVRIDDGRHYLLTSRERFDAITADPLDPWVKGAANLYTKEFFETAREHLNPGGVVTVYIQLFETNTAAVKSALATFFEVFPNGTIWGNTYEGRGHDMVLMGEVEPPRIDLDEIDRRLAGPEYSQVAQSLREVDMNSAVDLFSTYAGRGSDLKEWLKDGAINRDWNLRLQYLAGIGLNRDDSATIYSGMLAYRRFPDDVFVSGQGRVELLRHAIQSH